jgi:hypothetical protein
MLTSSASMGTGEITPLEVVAANPVHSPVGAIVRFSMCTCSQAKNISKIYKPLPTLGMIQIF